MYHVKKKLKLLAILTLITFSLTACSSKQDVEIIRITSKCTTPNIYCYLGGENIDEILGNYLKCIIDLKRSNEVCK